MNEFEMLKLFENVRKSRLATLEMLKSDREYLKMIAELLIDIEILLKKINLNAMK